MATHPVIDLPLLAEEPTGLSSLDHLRAILAERLPS